LIVSCYKIIDKKNHSLYGVGVGSQGRELEWEILEKSELES